MKLSYWERTSFFEDPDVVIVGAGIVGLYAALQVKEQSPNKKVLVIERDVMPGGASTKNAGFACFGSLSELIEQVKSSSETEFLELIKKRVSGINKLRSTLGDQNLMFENFGGYEIFKESDNLIWEECSSQLSQMNELINEAVSANNDVFQIVDERRNSLGLKNVSHLLFNPYESQIHSGKMMQTLIKLCRAKGIEILFGLEVKNINAQNDSVELEGENFKIISNQCIVCTNAFTNTLLPNTALLPGRGQVFITKPIANLKLKGCFHYDKGYYYFRNVEDRILIGGGRNLNFKSEETTEFGLSDEIQNALEQLLNEVISFDQAFEIDMRWSGIMAFGPELKPIIKKVQPNLYMAVRCNGMGVAMGSIIGEEVAKMLLDS